MKVAVQTIELTGKRLKAQLIGAWCLVLSSVVLGSLLQAASLTLAAFVVFWGGCAAGIAWELVTRLRIWWEHH